MRREEIGSLTSFLQYSLQHVLHSAESFPVKVAKSAPYLSSEEHDSDVLRGWDSILPSRTLAFLQMVPEKSMQEITYYKFAVFLPVVNTLVNLTTIVPQQKCCIKLIVDNWPGALHESMSELPCQRTTVHPQSWTKTIRTLLYTILFPCDLVRLPPLISVLIKFNRM